MLAQMQSALVFSDDQIATAFERVRRPKVTLYNYPETAFIERGRESSAVRGARDPVVLYLGGMERNRGSRMMLEAFEQVLLSVPDARLLVVGHFEPADLEHEIRADALQRGISTSVILTGRVPFEEIEGYLSAAVVGWVPWQAVPKNEKNVPTKLFEYMAYGLAVVASDLLSTRRFVQDGENGFRVAADDATAHAEAITRLLRDPEGAAAMGRTGQERVSTEYNWDEMGRRLVALFAELLIPS
jgi:glycosyltransferase involved in cell wall biosynthesis